jgi:hypothetical protein
MVNWNLLDSLLKDALRGRRRGIREISEEGID